MNKKDILFVSIIAIVFIAIGWFGYRQFFTAPADQVDKNLYQGKIVIGRVDWPGYLGLIIADKKGYFKDEGLDMEIRRYPRLTELLSAYRTDTLHGKANLTFDCVTDAYEGLDNMAVIAINQRNGADGIIARPGLSSLQNLQGKKVGVESGMLGEFFLRYALEQYEMKFEDIIPINLGAEQAAGAVVNGDVDAAVTYEPYMTKALQSSGGTLLFSSADAPGVMVDVLTMRADFVERYPETVQAIVRAYFRAIDFWKENPAEANAIVAQEFGVTPTDIEQELSGLTIFDAFDNRAAFTVAPGLQSLYGNMRAVADFLRQNDPKHVRVIDVDMMIDSRFIYGLTRHIR